MRKKILSLLIALCLLVTIFPINTQEVNAATYTQSQIKTKLQGMINGTSYGGKYKKGRNYTNCFSFAKIIFKNLYGQSINNLNYHGKYYYANTSKTIKLVGRCYVNNLKYPCECGGRDIATSDAKKKTTTLNNTNLKNLIKKMQSGDLLQGVGVNGTNEKNGNGKHQHTAIVYSVNKSNYTVTIYDANGLADGVIRLRTLTISNLKDGNFGHCISVYRSNKASTTTSWQSSLKAKNYASSGKTVLSWNSYSGASKYYVYRRKASSKKYTRIATTKSKTYVDKKATNGTYYYYYVKAISKSGKTLKTSSKISRTCDLARPTFKSITCIPSNGAIKVSFKGVKNANRYKIYRATGKKGKYSCIYTIKRKKADKGGESLYFINKNTTPGKTYYYKIRAVTTKNVGANSAISKYCYRTRDLARPVVKAKTRSDGKIVLSWKKIKHADKYYVYRAVKGGKYSKIATITGTSYTNTKSLKNGKTYYYKVKAIDKSNSAAASSASIAVSKKYTNKIIGFVSASTYKSKYKNSKKYSAKPYYRYKTRSVKTTTSTSSYLSGWSLVSKTTSYNYGSWTTTKPSTNYESKSVYYYYAYVCKCRKLYWKSSKSDICSNCNTNMNNLLKIYTSNNPASYYKKDTDGSYFTPKTLDKSNPGKLGTIYYMTYNGNSISKFISTSNKNTSFLWPSSSLKATIYRTKTPKTIYKYQKYSNWSSWSSWTSKYKSNSNYVKRDTTVKYYIVKK